MCIAHPKHKHTHTHNTNNNKFKSYYSTFFLPRLHIISVNKAHKKCVSWFVVLRFIFHPLDTLYYLQNIKDIIWHYVWAKKKKRIKGKNTSHRTRALYVFVYGVCLFFFWSTEEVYFIFPSDGICFFVMLIYSMPLNKFIALVIEQNSE